MGEGGRGTCAGDRCGRGPHRRCRRGGRPRRQDGCALAVGLLLIGRLENPSGLVVWLLGDRAAPFWAKAPRSGRPTRALAVDPLLRRVSPSAVLPLRPGIRPVSARNPSDLGKLEAGSRTTRKARGRRASALRAEPPSPRACEPAPAASRAAADRRSRFRAVTSRRAFAPWARPDEELGRRAWQPCLPARWTHAPRPDRCGPCSAGHLRPDHCAIAAADPGARRAPSRRTFVAAPAIIARPGTGRFDRVVERVRIAAAISRAPSRGLPGCACTGEQGQRRSSWSSRAAASPSRGAAVGSPRPAGAGRAVDGLPVLDRDPPRNPLQRTGAGSWSHRDGDDPSRHARRRGAARQADHDRAAAIDVLIEQAVQGDDHSS